MKNLLFILTLSLIFTSCKNNAKNGAGNLTSIQEIESKMKSLPAGTKMDTKMMDEAIAAYEAFAKASPNDKKAPEYLMKAAELQKNQLKLKEAMETYDHIISDFSSSPKAPAALFMKGFILENDMKDPEAAKVIYKDFLAKYPNDELADDVTFSLNNIGKTPEQIIQELQAKQKVDSTASATK